MSREIATASGEGGRRANLKWRQVGDWRRSSKIGHF